MTGNYETARRVLQLARRVFRYAVATARLTSDPSRDLKGAITSPQPKHYGAITDPKRVGDLLRAIDEYDGFGLTKPAMLLSAHVFVRPGELRHAEWSEIDLDAAIWIIPAAKMKMKREHRVPLSRQSIDLFRELRPITGPVGYVFPSIRTRSRPMSKNTINAGLPRLGFAGDEMTAHGFRAMASTLLNESGRWNPDAIERALAHGDSNKVRGLSSRRALERARRDGAMVERLSGSATQRSGHCAHPGLGSGTTYYAPRAFSLIRSSHYPIPPSIGSASSTANSQTGISAVSQYRLGCESPRRPYRSS